VVGGPDDLPPSFMPVEPDTRVHVLWCGPSAPAFPGVTVHSLGHSTPDAFRVRNLYEPSFPDFADRVRLTLERLHREHHFDRIELAVRGGLGFRAIQAKRAGLAFDGVTLAIHLDTCSQW